MSPGFRDVEFLFHWFICAKPFQNCQNLMPMLWKKGLSKSKQKGPQWCANQGPQRWQEKVNKMFFFNSMKCPGLVKFSWFFFHEERENGWSIILVDFRKIWDIIKLHLKGFILFKKQSKKEGTFSFKTLSTQSFVFRSQLWMTSGSGRWLRHN